MVEQILLALIAALLTPLLIFTIRAHYRMGHLEGRMEERDKRIEERLAHLDRQIEERLAYLDKRMEEGLAYINDELRKIWAKLKWLRPSQVG